MKLLLPLGLALFITAQAYTAESEACQSLRKALTSEAATLPSGLEKDLLLHWLEQPAETVEGQLLAYALKLQLWSLRAALQSQVNIPAGTRSYLSQLANHHLELDPSQLTGLWPLVEAYRQLAQRRYAAASAQFRRVAQEQNLSETIRAAATALAELYEPTTRTAKKGGMFQRIQECLFVDAGARQQFSASLRQWREAIPTIVRESGYFRLAGDSIIEIHYAGNSKELLLSLKQNGRELLEARPRPVFRAQKPWEIDEVMTMDGAVAAGLQLEFLFGRDSQGGRFDLNLKGQTGNGSLRVDWQALSEVFLYLPAVVRQNKASFTVSLPAAGGLLPEVFFSITFEKNFPREISLEKRNGTKLGFRELAFNERVREPNFSVRPTVVGLPIPANLLDSMLLSSLFPADKASNASQLELYHDLSLLAQNKVDALQLARKYSARSAQEAEVRLFAGWFYAAAYDFTAARQQYEQYFAAQEKDDKKKNVSFRLMFPEEPQKAYLSNLIHEGLYAEAARYAAYLKESAYLWGKPVEGLAAELALADIYLRAANYAAAQVSLAAVIKQAAELSDGELQRQAQLRQLVVGGYLGKLPGKIETALYPAAAAELLQALSLPGGVPVRLKEGTVLPGEGRNFCAPASLQYVIRVLSGKVVSQKEIAAEMKTTAEGTELRSILAYLRWHGFSVRVFPADSQEVAAHLTREEPVIALLWPPDSSIGHVAPVIGVDIPRDVYYFYEPARPFGMEALTGQELARQQAQTGSIMLAVSRGAIKDSDKATLSVVDFFDRFLQAPPGERLVLLEKIAADDEAKRYRGVVAAQRALAYAQLSDSRSLNAAQKQAAMALLSQAQPESSLEYKAFAELALRAGQIDTAELWLKAALEARPADVFTRLRLAEIALNRGQWEQAAQALKDVLRFAPVGLQPMVLQQLAVVAQQRGDKKEAFAWQGWAITLAGSEQDRAAYWEALSREVSKEAAEFLRIMAGMSNSE